MKRIGNLLAVLAVAVAGCGPDDSGMPAVTLLSPEGANHAQPTFSPDGRQVAYWTPSGTEWELVVAQADLSQPRTVATSNEIGPAAWSPDGSWLAFASNAWGSGLDLAIVPAAGGEIRRLTTSPAFEIPMGWHPSGDRLAYLQTAEGGTIRTSVVSLTGGEGSPLLSDNRPHVAAWSPDGSRVAINLFAGGAGTIWAADSAGGSLRQLTTEGLEEFDPWAQSWSPDGSELAYLSRRTGTADIWVLPVDSGAARQLTNDLRDDTEPAWSSDGRWVAFVSTRGQQTDVWVVSSTGGEAIRVTDDAAEEGRLQWVGPGTRLGFQKSSAASTLWALDAAGGAERQITPDSIRVGGFNVSPDGSQVAYAVVRGGGVTDLQVVSLAGGPPRVLVAGSHENQLAGWSPDGQTILFESNRGGNVDVWTVSAAGGAPRQLTNWPTYETNPAWTADGSGIYFLSDRDAKLRDIWLVPATGGEPRRITTVGSVNGIVQSSSSPDQFLNLLGGRAGQFVLARLEADGSLRTLWDRSNARLPSPDGVMPGADSVVINADLPEGGTGSFLISTRTGQGRQLLGRGELAADFSRDGTMLAYVFGGATQDLGILDMKDGTTRRLTNTPEREGGYWWAGDTKTIVVARRSQRSRIATVDVGPLLDRGR